MQAKCLLHGAEHDIKNYSDQGSMLSVTAKLRRIALIAFRRQGEGWSSAILLSLKKVFFIHSQLEVIQNE
jgi:hypothetical protein